MPLAQLIDPFPWYKYSKKLAGRIENPRCVGSFDKASSDERGVRLVIGNGGDQDDGNAVRLHWLVDRDDGVIIDARFTAFGQSALIGAADIACELCVGKNYDQAKRLTIEHLDKLVRDRSEIPSFPPETHPHLQLVLEAIFEAAEQCTDLPLASSYIAPPVPSGLEIVQGEGYPGWMDLPLQKKIAVIEMVLDEDVRPYISLDAGGVNVINLVDNNKVVITYSGTCTSCYASVGTTLSYIQQVLRAKVHKDITVVPEL